MSLELKGDFYSLAFFGLYLDNDDEEISSHHSYHPGHKKKHDP
jgi:hypothetical protein